MQNRNKSAKIKEFFEKNVWNILGTGIASIMTIIGLINVVVSKMYADSCSDYYGISARYFNGKDVILDRIIFCVAAIILILYPIFFNYINGKLKSKVYVIASFFTTLWILFTQNLVFTQGLIEEIQSENVRKFIDNYVTILIFVVIDIVIAFYMILRKYFWKNKSLFGVEKVILTLSLAVYFIDVSIGYTILVSRDVSDKKTYEVIDETQVIITEYSGKFLTMDCKIEDGVLYIDKGKYCFIEMEDKDIVYDEYDKVICK